ncbi:MAG TPA: uroporphyrinogen decarboxylase family protein [Armatimonadota bacterium]|nr:uroporphyrinogen decarboxylase family protein [Armatimonadota bacterium]
MTSRERLTAVLARRLPDRVPMVDIAFWPQTLERWRREGLPADVEPGAYFGLDEMSGVGLDCSLQLPERTLEETADYRIVVDRNGVTTKEWRDTFATPGQLEFTITDADAWRAHRERLRPDPTRISDAAWQSYRDGRARDAFVYLNPGEPFWRLLRIVGHETALLWVAEQPELVAEILADYTDFIIANCDMTVAAGLECDGVWLFSDLCYKNGMLFSPRAYRELLQPHHRRMAEMCRRRGWPFILHCDGDVRQFIPLLIESGFDCIQPLEARAGNDVRELKPLYGDRIVFFGNINADAMARGGEELEAEVRSKLLAAKPGGGYIYHSDHSIPPTISFESYRRVIELVRELGRYEE